MTLRQKRLETPASFENVNKKFSYETCLYICNIFSMLTGCHSGALPPQIFCSPQILLCPENFVLHPQTLKPGHGPEWQFAGPVKLVTPNMVTRRITQETSLLKQSKFKFVSAQASVQKWNPWPLEILSNRLLISNGQMYVQSFVLQCCKEIKPLSKLCL